MLRRANRQKHKGGSEPFTYIHKATTLKGDLKAQGRVRVHGTIYGNVEVDGVLEVADSGFLQGELIRADEVKIIGSVKANIESKGKIEIWKNGRLEGDVRAAALDIEEGATFIGRSEMSAASTPIGTLTEAAASVSEVDS